MAPRSNDRREFSDHDRIVLGEKDHDDADVRYEKIEQRLQWVMRTLVAILLSLITGFVMLYLQRVGQG